MTPKKELIKFTKEEEAYLTSFERSLNKEERAIYNAGLYKGFVISDKNDITVMLLLLIVCFQFLVLFLRFVL